MLSNIPSTSTAAMATAAGTPACTMRMPADTLHKLIIYPAEMSISPAIIRNATPKEAITT